MPDANVTETSGSTDDDVRGWVSLRNDAFDLRCNILGATTEEARASLVGVNYRTLHSARRGGVGEKFIALTLAAFERHATVFAEMNIPITFEDLFVTAAVPAGMPT